MPGLSHTSHSVAITTLRFLLSAWIGAAVLYVITSVAEQTSDNFDSLIRDQLATIRFPLYYAFGAVIFVSTGLMALVTMLSAPDGQNRRAKIILGLIVAASIVFVADYSLVYRPLQELIIPPGQARTQEFVRLHNLSRHANELHLTIMLLAAVLAAIPQRSSVATGPEAE